MNEQLVFFDRMGSVYFLNKRCIAANFIFLSRSKPKFIKKRSAVM